MIQVAKDQEKADDEPSVKTPPMNIHRFLNRVGIMEIKYIRMLASLCSLTYEMRRMTVSLCADFSCTLASFVAVFV